MFYDYLNDEDDRRSELLSEAEDIYQTELTTYGTTSFDISDLEGMSIEELEDFISSHWKERINLWTIILA